MCACIIIYHNIDLETWEMSKSPLLLYCLHVPLQQWHRPRPHLFNRIVVVPGLGIWVQIPVLRGRGCFSFSFTSKCHFGTKFDGQRFYMFHHVSTPSVRTVRTDQTLVIHWYWGGLICWTEFSLFRHPHVRSTEHPNLLVLLALTFGRQRKSLAVQPPRGLSWNRKTNPLKRTKNCWLLSKHHQTSM